MSILDNKIAVYDKLAAMLPDKPNASDGLTAEQLKLWFDAAPEQIRIEFNELIDTLYNQTGSANIGVVPLAGLSGTNLQDILISLKAYSDGSVAACQSIAQSLSLGETPIYKTFVDDASIDGDVYTYGGLRREDNTLAVDFALTNKVNGLYLTKTYKSYGADGATVLSTTVRTLTYKPNGTVMEA